MGLLASVGIVKGKPFEPDGGCAGSSRRRSPSGTRPPARMYAPRPEEGFAFYPGLAVVQLPVRRRLRVHRPAAADHGQGRRCRTERRRAQAQCPDVVLLHGDRDHARDVHVPDRHRLAVHRRDARQPGRVLRRRLETTSSPCPRTSRRAGSGRSCCTTVRRARCSRRASPSRPSGARSGTVETNADGTTDIYFGPAAPAGKEHNWLQTVPGKGWWTILRLYNPLEPFFDKTWRPSEIEPV